MDREKVLQLAKLARIEMGEGEAEKLSKEFGQILNYVSEVKKVGEAKEAGKEYEIRNIMRPGGEPHESGIHTEKLLSQAPSREGDYLKVKKIL